MSEPLVMRVDKFVFRVPTDRWYTTEGLWCLPVEGQPGIRVRVGLTDFLQQHSGDIAFASAKPAGTQVTPADCLAEIETVKTVVELPSPFKGTVLEANEALKGTPDVINDDPYGKGWLAVIQVPDWNEERGKLLDAQGYFSVMQALVKEELKSP